MKLEEFQPNTSIRGIIPDGSVTVVTIKWYGPDALELTYKDANGRVANQIIYRDDESRYEIVVEGRPWSFDGDGALFRLVSEAQRIRLTHLFDPLFTVLTYRVEPLLPQRGVVALPIRNNILGEEEVRQP